ncbi:uncharacterized protein LOC134738802 [Pongo pygmaeus]|uniref:uncharacterized protein LOC134738802 n=1 Tax=Pongo pygmaeus TaxID=9600 RepID=UPI00300D334D
MVTPSLPPGDRHEEFAVVTGAGPTLLRRLTPPEPVLLDCVDHPARWPHLLSLEGFQRRCSCREQTYPAPASWPPILSRRWLALVVCKREARPVATRSDNRRPRIAGVVSTPCPTLPQSVPGAETACSWRLVARVSCASGAATPMGRAWALRPGTVPRSVVDQCTLWLCALRLAWRCFSNPRRGRRGLRGLTPTIPPSRLCPGGRVQLQLRKHGSAKLFQRGICTCPGSPGLPATTRPALAPSPC